MTAWIWTTEYRKILNSFVWDFASFLVFVLVISFVHCFDFRWNFGNVFWLCEAKLIVTEWYCHEMNNKIKRRGKYTNNTQNINCVRLAQLIDDLIKNNRRRHEKKMLNGRMENETKRIKNKQRRRRNQVKFERQKISFWVHWTNNSNKTQRTNHTKTKNTHVLYSTFSTIHRSHIYASTRSHIHSSSFRIGYIHFAYFVVYLFVVFLN